jgi:hypothetical protein
MLTVPGWTLLSVLPVWRDWNRLQRWCIAIGLSMAVYPVLFYGLRLILPGFTLGPFKMAALLAVCAAIAAWRLRGHWREQFAFERTDWIAIAVVGATLFTRFWIIRDIAYPAWSDSLHHALLTQLTAGQGRLPFDMQPYFPIPLNLYHLGTYALTASTEWLAQVPAHSAVLWTMQLLNGLCGVGVFLVLDRKVGRVGAIVGTVVAGLMSFQPAFYVNWGRYTQLASQTIMLIAWLVAWQAIAGWKHYRTQRAVTLWNTLLAGLLTAAVLQFHFRVAAFYLPLLGLVVAWEFYRAGRDRQRSSIVLGTLAVGAIAVLLVTPAMWPALGVYIERRSAPLATVAPTITPEELERVRAAYYVFPLDTIPVLAAPIWLLGLTIISAVWGVLRRNRLVILMLAWFVILLAIGLAYLTGVRLLEVTNLGAVLMMWYLPIALIVGAAAEELNKWLTARQQTWAAPAILTVALLAGFAGSHSEVMKAEDYRFYVTPADEAAMNWIRVNTPPDARFAINTYFWQPRGAIGTDGGYWIPYFTGRQTTAGSMLTGEGSPEYGEEIHRMSKAAEKLAEDSAALDELRALGVDYVYIGAKGNSLGQPLRPTRLGKEPGVERVYQQDGVTILRLSSGSSP